MARRSKAKLFSAHSRGAIGARLRKLIIISAIGCVSFVTILILGYSQLMSYLQGDSFRQKAAETMQQASGAAAVEINGNFNIQGNRISTDGIRISSFRNIPEASASRISAELNRTALFSRKLHLYKLSMEEASLSIQTTENTSPQPQQKKSPAKKKKKGQSAALTSTRNFTPKLQNIELEIFECRDTDLKLQHHDDIYQLLGANVSATPAPKIGPQAWQINAENARLHTPFSFLRDSSIKSATVVYNADKANVTECRIMLTPGEMRVKAHYDMKAGAWSADLQVNKGDMHRILNDDWKKRVTGKLYGRMQLIGNGGDITSATGSFTMQDGILEGLPFLSQLPIGNTYPYRSIELEKAECQILYPGNSSKTQDAWLIDKINISSRDGALLVRGHVLIGKDKSLGGTLTIGIPKNTLAALPLSQEELTSKLFTASGDDAAYLWLNMNLHGTLEHPQEDLSVRIATLAGKKLSKLLKEIPKGTASTLLNTLLQKNSEQQEAPAEDTAEPSNLPSKVIDAAGSLFQSLF